MRLMKSSPQRIANSAQKAQQGSPGNMKDVQAGQQNSVCCKGYASKYSLYSFSGSATTNSAGAFSIIFTRFLAISQYSWLMSIPMYCLPISQATLAVVPLPLIGSKTVSPELVHDLIWSLTNSQGNGAGGPFASCSFCFLPTTYSQMFLLIFFSFTSFPIF